MRRESPLPPCWKVLEGRVNYVQQESNSTWTSSCPTCGGEVHEDGSLPNRCTLFADEHPSLFCRRCGLVAFPDLFGAEGYTRPDAETLEKWRLAQEQKEEARRRSAERALEHLRSSLLWEHLHDNMGRIGRAFWTKRGVPEAFQDYWQLGYSPQERFSYLGQPWITPAATIPLFDEAWNVLNIKMRLVNVPPDDGRYRYALTGQPGPLFRCTPEKPLTGHVIAVEGEIKAAVTFATLDDAKLCMVGLPGKTPGQAIITQLSQAERVTLIADPDARAAAWAMAKRIGLHKTRVFMCSSKIDDAIVTQGLTKKELRYVELNAIPAG